METEDFHRILKNRLSTQNHIPNLYGGEYHA
jgi:hypothetical protein